MTYFGGHKNKLALPGKAFRIMYQIQDASNLVLCPTSNLQNTVLFLGYRFRVTGI